MMVRIDALEEAGIDRPPETWEEIVEAVKALTIRDESGRVQRWGFAFGGAPNAVSAMIPYYWQAGGDFMTEDGVTATIGNDAMRETLQWMHDLVWVHEVASPEFMEKTFDLQGDFISGRVAIMGSTGVSWANEFDRYYPEIEGEWALALSAMGPENRDTFSGAGYYGVLNGSDGVDACVDWIAFLSRPENMRRLSETSGNVSPMRAVMESEAWSDRPWKRVATLALENAGTSQLPSPTWSAIATPESGAVLHDMIYDPVVLREDIDATVPTAQERMQAELDRASN